MAAERYLLNELSSEQRDAFEEHMFSCQECAMDIRAADSFIREAKQQLAQFPASSAAAAAIDPPRKALKIKRPFFSFRPAFAVPVFAMLLAVIAYQNLATIPSLRSAASEPRVMPWSSVHLGARGGAAEVNADRQQGAVLLIQLPQSATYPSYTFELSDSQGQKIWSRTAAAPTATSEGTLSLVIPSAGLQTGSYTLAVSGHAY
jgi:anti-sigma factor RsiW